MTTSLVPITRRDKRQLCAKIVPKKSVFQKPRAKFDLIRPMIKFDYCNPEAQNAYSPPEFLFHFISFIFSPSFFYYPHVPQGITSQEKEVKEENHTRNLLKACVRYFCYYLSNFYFFTK